MKKCPNCRNEVIEEATFCPICGNALGGVPGYDPDFHPELEHAVPVMPVYTPPVVETDPYDHTEEFISADIEETRLVCMLVYLLDFVGIIIALLAAGSSEYTHFHIRQSMKFTVLEILLTAASIILFWTFVVPILGIIALVVLLVIKFISFADVCSGKAKEPMLIRNIAFLR